MDLKNSVKNNSARLCKKGFTLVEVVIVIGIFAVISAIILFNYSSFRSNTTVNTVAQEIALTVRKAQSYSLGLQAPGLLSGLPVKGYGVRFESNKPDQIVFFAEISPIDNQYTVATPDCSAPAPGQECVEYYRIETGDIIQDIIVDGEVINLTDPSSSIDIIFKKPTGETVFCVHKFSSTCSSSSTSSVGVVDVLLVSKSGINKTVRIYANGQISVK